MKQETESKHTPGPWTIEHEIDEFNGGRRKNGRVFIQAGGCFVARTFEFCGGKTEEANAELIASAPDLLAERDRLREQIDVGTRDFARMRAERDSLKVINGELARALSALVTQVESCGYEDPRYFGSLTVPVRDARAALDRAKAAR